MPKYNLRLGSSTFTVANTDEAISKRFLDRGQPQTQTDSGGSMGKYSWQGQELDRTELRKVKQIREKGGLVSWLFESKSLMKFGTGAELQSENDDLQEWLNENFERLDLLTLDLGSDGIWYPYGLGEVVETNAGEFSHIECIEPWTMLPKTNEYGEIMVWEQETQDRNTKPFQPEEIGSIVLNKSSGRDKVGVSEVLRSEEEITQYKENQRAVNKAIEIAGFPHHVWTVGAEGRSPVDDNDLRRVRNLIDNMDGDTQFVVGPDVDHDKITAADFDFEGVTKRDLRILTTTVGLPLEMAGYGREGLGSGSETDLIGDLLALQNEVSRRRFETQFVEEFVRPVVRDYSPYSEDEHINMQINPFLDEREDVADLINKIGEYMSTAEVRDKLDLPPLEDDELAESYRSPESIEEAEEGPDEDPMGGLFGEKAEQAVDTALENRDLGDSGNLKLVDESTPDFDRHYLQMLETGPYTESEKLLVSFSESAVPEMVQERIRDTIQSGVLFSDFESISSSRRMELQNEFINMLSEDGWTTDSLVEQLQEFEPDLSDARAENIARSETAEIINTSREEAYLERDLEDDLFKWTGTDEDGKSDNHRTTRACGWLKEQTNPKFGGTPRPLDELKELIGEAWQHDDDMNQDLSRGWTVHPQERHTFTRHVS